MQRLIGVGHAVVRFVLIAQALQDQEGVIQGRLLHLDWLEAALQGGILFDVLAVFLKGRSTDGLQLATSQLRLEQRGSIDSAFSSTSTNQGVDLIDEQDDVAALVNLLEHLLQAFLKVTAVTGAGNQGAQVERVKLLVLEGLWNLAVDDVERQALNDGGLTNARLTDEDRVILRTARQHLHDALYLGLTANDRIELAVLRGLGEVAAELVEHQGIGTLAGTAGATTAARAGTCTSTRANRTGALAVGGTALLLAALITGQQLDNLLAHARQVGAELGQHLGGNAVALANETQ